MNKNNKQLRNSNKINKTMIKNKMMIKIMNKKMMFKIMMIK